MNVLVYAHRPDSRRHAEMRRWLETNVAAEEPVGLTDAVLTGFVRVVTNARIHRDPTPTDRALEAVEVLLAQSGTLRVVPGRSFWSIFAKLCRAVEARGNLVADATHAATAIEAGATWVTFDRDFARFPGLSWKVPA